MFHQDTSGIASAAGINETFGRALAAGDIDNDNFPDLIIGAPRQNVGSLTWAGAVHVLWGTSQGITTSGDVYITE